jgi:hypothetical protein
MAMPTITRTGALAVAFALGALGLSDPTTARRAQQGPETAAERRFAVPISLVEEHAALYSAFEAASQMSGETGAAARHVAALRTPHVAKEQRVAYPLLRLLPLVSTAKLEPWMVDLLPLADQLRAALPSLKQDHVAIRKALVRLKYAAQAEGHPQYAFLADRLVHHFQIEEEILYPAALVTADYVREGLSRQAPPR